MWSPAQEAASLWDSFLSFRTGFFHLFFFHFTLVSAPKAPGKDVRAGPADALQMSHVMLLLVSSTSGICEQSTWLAWVQSESSCQKLDTLVSTAHKKITQRLSTPSLPVLPDVFAASLPQFCQVLRIRIYLDFFFHYLIRASTSPFLPHIPSSRLPQMSITHLLLVFAQCRLCRVQKNNHIKHTFCRLSDM